MRPRRSLVSEVLTADAYAPYGRVVSAGRNDVVVKAANQGTAARRDWLVDLENRREGARLNVASFRCAPQTEWPRDLALLEKHPHSTQLFVPMNARRFLVVVALGDEAPDLATTRAFVATGTQGVSYHPGVWHHPMIALDEPTDFACFVWEDGTDGDCSVCELSADDLTVEVTG